MPDVSGTYEPDSPHRSTKDTRRWCKGKVGREHVLVVENRHGWRCGSILDFCWHSEWCSVCGKRVKWRTKVCPDTLVHTEG